MGRRWRAWVWDALASVVGYGLCLAFAAVPVSLLIIACLQPPPPPPPDYLEELRASGPAVFTEVADGRWRAGDPADAFIAAHPPDSTLVYGGGVALHFYRGGQKVRELVVVATDGRLYFAWGRLRPGDAGVWLLQEPLPLYFQDDPPLIGRQPAELQLDYRLGLLAVIGPGGAVLSD